MMRNRMKALTQEVVGLGWGSFTQLFRSKGIRSIDILLLRKMWREVFDYKSRVFGLCMYGLIFLLYIIVILY